MTQCVHFMSSGFKFLLFEDIPQYYVFISLARALNVSHIINNRVLRLASSYSSSYDLSWFGDSQGHFMQCTFACKMNSSPCRGLKRQIDAVGLSDSFCVVCLRMQCGMRQGRSLVFCLGVFCACLQKHLG
jgi:hypothetical protein